MDSRKRPGQPIADDPSDDSFDPADDRDDPTDVDVAPVRRPRRDPSLDGFSVAGITRRRLGWLVAAVLCAWILLVFGRQVADTAAKGAEADRARTSNAQATQTVTDLQRELALITQPAFVTQQAHGLGLGGAKDHAFVLAADAPPLPDDAPGSAAVRLGGQVVQPSPLDSWLSVLFGPPGT